MSSNASAKLVYGFVVPDDILGEDVDVFEEKIKAFDVSLEFYGHYNDYKAMVIAKGYGCDDYEAPKHISFSDMEIDMATHDRLLEKAQEYLGIEGCIGWMLCASYG